MNFGKYQKNQQENPVNFHTREGTYQFKAINPHPHSLNKCSSHDRIPGIGIESRITIQKSPNHYSRPDSQPGIEHPPRFRNGQSFQNNNENFSVPNINRDTSKQKKDDYVSRRQQKTKLIDKVRRFQEQLQAFDNNFYANKNYESENINRKQHSDSAHKIQTSFDRKIVEEHQQEKKQLVSQISTLSYDNKNLQRKYENVQKQYSELQSRFDNLISTRTVLQETKRLQREQMLASELSLSRRKSEKLKEQYQRQILSLKQKIQGLESKNMNSSRSMATLPFNNSFMDDRSNILSASNSPGIDNNISSHMEQLQADLKKKNQMIKYLQMQCRRASLQSQEGKDKISLENARLNELYEIAKKQLLKVERINEILKHQNQELDGKLSESQKLLKVLKQKYNDERLSMRGDLKNDTAANQDKIFNELHNQIKNLEKDKEQLREKVAYFVGKDREKERQKEKQINEKQLDKRNSGKKLEFRDNKYQDMLARSEKLRKQSLQELQKREEIIKNFKKQEQILKKRIKQLQANQNYPSPSPTKSNSSSDRKRQDTQKRYHEICKGYEQELEKIKIQYKTLMEMKKKIQSVLEVSQQQYKKLQKQNQTDLFALRQQIRTLKKQQSSSINVQQLTEKYAYLQKQNDSLKESYFILEQKKQLQMDNKDKLSKQLQQLKKQLVKISSSWEQNVKKLKEEKDKLRQQIIIKENNTIFLQQEREKWKKKVEQFEKQRKKLSAQPDQEKARIKNELQKAEEMIFQKQQEIAKLLNKNQSIQKQYDTLVGKVGELASKQVKLKKEVAVLQENLKVTSQSQMKTSMDLAQKQLHSKDIQQQLEELTKQFTQLKTDFTELEKYNSQLLNSNKKSVTSSILSLQQSCDLEDKPNFIEIDKNALLYICDLLSIEPVDGELLKSIIQFLEQTRQEWFIVDNYKEVLELFGVDSVITDKTQQILIQEITSFRASLSEIITKMSSLEAKCDNLSKENHRLHKISSKSEANKALVAPLKQALKDTNEEIIKLHLSFLSAKKQIQLGS